MADTSEGRRSIAPYAPGTLAAIIVVTTMSMLFWRFSGDLNHDWEGYRNLFDDAGGYLTRQGRDPLFVRLLDGAAWVFGPGGYEQFRQALFMVFALFAAWLAYGMCVQARLPQITSIVTALVVITAFLLKGLVQIREGLAFIFVVAPMVRLFGRGRPAMLRTGIGAVVAVGVHVGTGLFLLAWGAAAVLSAFPPQMVRDGRLQFGLLVGGVGMGLVLALLIQRNAEALSYVLQDYGFESAEPIGGLVKYLYWAANGVLVLILRAQLVGRPAPHGTFAFAYAATLGSVILPVLYTVCFSLVLVNFYMTSLTTAAIRLLFTSMEIATIIIALRGRANLLTVAVTLAMLADRARGLAV